jgi:hypothetical protein
VDLHDVSLHSLPPVSSSDWLGTTLATDDELTRLVELPSFATRDLPSESRIASQLLDGRLLVAHGARGPLAVLDPRIGELVELADVAGELRGGSFDHVDVFAAASASVAEAAVWRVPLDSTPARQLATRATRAWFELDGRIVTPLAVEDGLGDLVAIDHETLAERLVDGHVVASVQGRGEHETFHERDIVYSVVDGDRSGIWLARLEPRD